MFYSDLWSETLSGEAKPRIGKITTIQHSYNVITVSWQVRYFVPKSSGIFAKTLFEIIIFKLMSP